MPTTFGKKNTVLLRRPPISKIKEGQKVTYRVVPNQIPVFAKANHLTYNQAEYRIKKSKERRHLSGHFSKQTAKRYNRTMVIAPTTSNAHQDRAAGMHFRKQYKANKGK